MPLWDTDNFSWVDTGDVNLNPVPKHLTIDDY